MLRYICAFLSSNRCLLKQIRREIKTMSHQIDALTAAQTELADAVHDALDKIQELLGDIADNTADEAAIAAATEAINDQINAIRAVVPDNDPVPPPVEEPVVTEPQVTST